MGVNHFAGDDGIFAALVLAHNERLQKAMRGDGCCQLVEAAVRIGLADIAFPGEQPVQGIVVPLVMMCLFRFE